MYVVSEFAVCSMVNVCFFLIAYSLSVSLSLSVGFSFALNEKRLCIETKQQHMYNQRRRGLRK